MGVREVLPKLLQLFKLYDVRASFASVGMLFARDTEELLECLPAQQPTYKRPRFSPYGNYIKKVITNKETWPYHIGGELINLIQEYPEHEIGSHTFSHYYCLEEGQTLEQFQADLLAAKAIAQDKGLELSSLVFPRNQYAKEQLEIAAKVGFHSFRGNEKAWFYRAVPESGNSYLKRGFKLLDAYINFSGHNTTALDEIKSYAPYNIPSSRFLRPYSPALKIFEGLRMRRIKKSMTYAAQSGEVFHLWWHPHNFGIRQEDNLSFLEESKS